MHQNFEQISTYVDDYYEDFKVPTVKFLETFLIKIMDEFDLSKNESLVVIAEFMSSYANFNENAFTFFNNNNFNYNSEGNYYGDSENLYLLFYALEYRNFDLVKKLHSLGANLHVTENCPNLSMDNSIECMCGAIERLVIGHGSGDSLDDYSEILKYLIDNGVQLQQHDIFLFIKNIDDVNGKDLHQNVRQILMSASIASIASKWRQ